MAGVIIAAIVGGVVIVAWSFVSHMLLPIAEMGMQSEKRPGEKPLRLSMNGRLAFGRTRHGRNRETLWQMYGVLRTNKQLIPFILGVQ